jgi:hypothetical protein
VHHYRKRAPYACCAAYVALQMVVGDHNIHLRAWLHLASDGMRRHALPVDDVRRCVSTLLRQHFAAIEEAEVCAMCAVRECLSVRARVCVCVRVWRR